MHRALRRSFRYRYLVLPIAGLLAAAACGSGGDDSAAGSAGGDGKPAISITSPANGATVSVPFKLTFTSTAKLGPTDSGRDHVHVFTDGNEGDYTVVPNTSFEIKDLSPGQHTVGVTLQHADHSPAGARAEITVTVAGSGSAGGASTSSPSASPGGTGTSGDDSGGGDRYGY